MKKIGLRILATISALAVLVGTVVTFDAPTPAVATPDSVTSDEAVGGGDDTSTPEGEPAEEVSTEPDAEQEQGPEDSSEAEIVDEDANQRDVQQEDVAAEDETILPPAVGRAAPSDNYCTVPGVYSLDTATNSTTRNVRSFPLDSSASAIAGTFTTLANNNTLNGLAIMPDGSAAFAVERAGNTYRLHRVASDADAAAVVHTTGSVSTNAGNATVGAINPAGTIYYFGQFIRSGGVFSTQTRLELFAYNITNQTSPTYIGQVGRIVMSSATIAGVDGDITFDAGGNMLILWGSGNTTQSRLYSLANPPTTESTTQTTPAALTTISSTNNYAWNGLAFSADGNLWVQRQASATTTYRAQLNSATGALTNGATLSAPAFAGNDLASCLPTASLSWSVVQNGTSTPVGGATVQVQGPRISGTGGGVNGGTWGGPYNVTDNVWPDVDSRDGYFKVTELGGAAISQASRYGIRQGSAPTDYVWTTPEAAYANITATGTGAAGINVPSSAAWPASSPSYDFGTLVVNQPPTLNWRVQDSANTPVGGATVQLRGPRTGTSGNDANGWGTVLYNVTDCIEGPCAPISMDQDPRRGYFSVHTLRWGTTSGFQTLAVSQDQRYGMMQIDSPIGWMWTTPTTSFTNIPWAGDNSTTNRNTPARTGAGSWPLTQAAYDFGVIRVTAGAYLGWEVKDEGGNLVGGSTVRLQGPRTGNTTTWTRDYFVTDCTEGPCHPESMDQDPAAGIFKVDSLRGLDGSVQTTIDVNNSSRYRIQGIGSIPEHTWTAAGTAWKEIPQGTGGTNSPAWGTGLGYNFADLTVTSGGAASAFCSAPTVANSYYTLNRPGTNSVNINRLTTNGTETAINGGSTELLSSAYSLVGTGQSGNALGTTPTGVFYFTGQNTTANTNIEQMRNATVYRYDPSVDTAPYPVMNMDMLSPTTGTIVAGDATIYQGREEFYFAYYSDTPAASLPADWANGGIRFHLYRFSMGNGDRTGEVRHIDVPKNAAFGAGMNGDFAFDGQNNLQFIISDGTSTGNVVSGVVPASDFQSQPSAHALPDVTTIQATANYFTVAGGQVNGVTYTKSGRAIVQQTSSSRNRLVNLPAGTNVTTGTTFTGAFVDLASCDSPTSIAVQKNVVGERYEETDQFTLSAERNAGTSVDPFTPATTTGGDSGIQDEQVGPFVTTMAGTFSASETINANSDNYSTTWECHALNTDGSKKASFASGAGRNLSFPLSGAGTPADVVPGANLVCVFSNETLRPMLATNKTANPVSTTPVDAAQTVQYRLEFDNSTGTSPAIVDHTDHLADVFDDANFVTGSIRYGDGTEAGYPGSGTTALGVTAAAPLLQPQIAITGSVPAGEKRTVWFEVTVKANTAERPDPSDNTGFVLNNYLTPSTEEPPTSCEATDLNCTTHPIRAWTVSKESQPRDGAWLHSGGNVYYMVNVTKVGAQNSVIPGIVVEDDMTEVMGVARMDIHAPNYGPRFVFDVKTYNENGDLERSFVGTPTDSWDTGAFEVSDLFPTFTGTPGVTDPTDPGWQWQTTLPAFTLQADEVRAQIVYVVQVGGAADPADPTSFQLTAGDEPAYPPAMLTEFVNSVGATSTDLPPNECVLGADPVDAQCKVAHTVSGNYFHIQKNSTERDSNGTGVITNLPGVEFEILDSELSAGWPAKSSSAQLCWSNYKASYDVATSTWTRGDDVGTYAAGASPDWLEGSTTYQSIIDYNNDPAHFDTQKSLCALSYALADNSTGQAAGTWHVRDLATGDYQLVETKAPAGHQLLAEPIMFTVGDAASEYQLFLPNPNSPSDILARCDDPWQLPSNGTLACVMQTGWLMQVYDTKSPALPLTGGQWLGILTTGGLIVLVSAVAGAAWWRRRQSTNISADHS